MTRRIPQANDYDVAVVGAGSTGHNTAGHLADNYGVLMLEKGELEENASANANAFISDWRLLPKGEHVPGVAMKVRDYFERLSATDNSESRA